jgi:hypothetical protein
LIIRQRTLRCDIYPSSIKEKRCKRHEPNLFYIKIYIGHYFVNRLIVTIFRCFNKLMYILVPVKRYNIYIYDIVIVVSIRVVKILLKMVVFDRNIQRVKN